LLVSKGYGLDSNKRLKGNTCKPKLIHHKMAKVLDSLKEHADINEIASFTISPKPNINASKNQRI